MKKKRGEKEDNSDMNTDTQESDITSEEEEKMKNDKISILVLSFLYVLQGIPLGLAVSIPMILQERKISYKEQAVFSFAFWPFSMKLLWAPIVDSIYWKFLGRRKSWLIPSQYLIGVCMITLSFYVSSLLGDSDNSPDVNSLATAFFCLVFLTATQDVAVDGWALTMLSRKKIGYAAICNSVGQTAGALVGNVVFLSLESADFCNKFLRSVPQPEGMVTLSSFLRFWGIVFLITTSLILVFKREREERLPESHGIKETYLMLYSILRLRNIWLLVSLLLTFKIAFTATDSIAGLKFIEAGVHKENFALMQIPLIPLQTVLPLAISNYTAGPKPLSVFLKIYPFRVVLGILIAVLVWWTYHAKEPIDGCFPYYYYFTVMISYGILQITHQGMQDAMIAFCARISDSSIGGTYMTLLTTIYNLGGKLTSTVALWFVDILTSKSCENAPQLSCATKELAEKCEEAGHQCVTYVDGYYIETAFCVIFGFIWLRWGRSAAKRLQSLPLSAWKSAR